MKSGLAGDYDASSTGYDVYFAGNLFDVGARGAALEEGRAALAKLSPEEMVLRDEVIYSVGRALG